MYANVEDLERQMAFSKLDETIIDIKNRLGTSDKVKDSKVRIIGAYNINIDAKE